MLSNSIQKWLKLTSISIISGISVAHAARTADLSVSISAVSNPVRVSEMATYQISVVNLESLRADNVRVEIQLPKTNTSPQVYILGNLGVRDSRCAISGTKLICLLGSVTRNNPQNVRFDISLPQANKILSLDAKVFTSTSETSSANNSASLVPAIIYKSIAILSDRLVNNRHCTGRGLSSFFECLLFPSSISGHPVQFLGNGTIDIGEPGYTGSWSQAAPDQLSFQYFENGTLILSFSGRGATDNCFWGVSTFPGSEYNSAYEVCLQ